MAMNASITLVYNLPTSFAHAATLLLYLPVQVLIVQVAT